MNDKEEYLNLSHTNILSVSRRNILSITLTGLLCKPYLAESASIYHNQAQHLLLFHDGADAGMIARQPDCKVPCQGLFTLVHRSSAHSALFTGTDCLPEVIHRNVLRFF